MEQALTGFVRALRAVGLDSSTAETLDAARAVALVGYARRDHLKTTLGLVLAKSEAEKVLHDEVFERYFAPPLAPPASPAEAPATATYASAVSAASASASGDDADQAKLDNLTLDLRLAQAAHAAGVDEIRFVSQVPMFTQRLLAELATPGGPAPDAALRARARALVAQRFELHGRAATEAFLTEVAVARPLGRVSPPDMQRMQAVVARLAKRLAVRHSRRRRVRLRHQLDLRRTLRANAGHDGLPWALHFKHKRRDRPRIVVLCDVSGSVMAHVRFLLLLLYAMHDEVADLRTFAFSNRLHDVGAVLAQQPFDEALATILRQAGGGATDYGQALADLSALPEGLVNRHTTLLVLGDGRSNHADPRLDLMATLADRARRVLWLCPEPPGRWGSGDSCMLQYQPYCTHLSHCTTVLDLEQAIDQALLL